MQQTYLLPVTMMIIIIVVGKRQLEKHKILLLGSFLFAEIEYSWYKILFSANIYISFSLDIQKKMYKKSK